MARFKGSFQFCMDPKGRVALPSAFRKILGAETEQPTVTAVPGLKGALYVFPENEFDAWVDSFYACDGGYDSSNERHQSIDLTLHACSFDLKLDTAGRINIPQELRDKCGLGKDVTIVGKRDHMEVWDSDAWKAELAAAPSLDDLVFKRV